MARVGLLLAVAWVRLTDPAWYALGGVEPLVYTAAAAVSFFVAVLAGIPSARRAGQRTGSLPLIRPYVSDG